MSNRTYDFLKNVSLFAVPIIAFISSLLSIWNIPNAELWTASLTALDTLFGGIVIIANKVYKGKQEE